jgi:cell division protein FtsN
MTWASSLFTACLKTFNTTVTAYRDQILTTSTETTNGTPTPRTTHITGDYANSTQLPSGTMIADEVVIYWQATDLPKFDSDYASLLARRLDIDFTPTPTASATATSTIASNSDDTSKTTGLSTGAKAGIGVGAAVIVILLCVAGFLLYKGKHRKEARTFLKNDQPELVQAERSEATA